jgi:hypothetical protein
MTHSVVHSAEIVDAVLIIRINQLYRPNMSAHALYEATRGVWRLGPRCEGAKLALAVFDGIVREAYEIDEWHAAGTTSYTSRDMTDLRIPGRREFVGRVASNSVRDRYVGRSVAGYLKRGQQNPVVYVNC